MRITKQIYQQYKRCPKLVYFHLNKPKDFDPKDFVAVGFYINQGKEVGILARQLFSNDQSILIEDVGHSSAVIKTNAAILQKQIIFEGAFEFDDLFTRPDVYNSSTKELIEIKSTTEVTEEHLLDVAFQKYVVELSGSKVKTVKIGILNKNYLLDGELNAEELFSFQDVTDKLDTYLTQIGEDLRLLRSLLKDVNSPNAILAHYCFTPHRCSYLEDCFGKEAYSSVLDLRRDVKGKKYDLFNNGIKSINN